MTIRSHFLFWTLAATGFIGFVVLFKSILLPFVLGMVIAYLLNPLGRLRISRGPAALFILLGFLALLLSFFALLIPVLHRELSDFSRDLPEYIDRLTEMLAPYSEKIQNQDSVDLKAILRQNASTGLNAANQVLYGMAAGGLAILNILSLLVITPIVAYFMMKEWINITNWVKDLMPRDQKNTIMDLLDQINRKLAGFIRGQISVAFILGIMYALALTLVGLKYGLLIGFTAGLLSIIPMLGSIVGFVTGVLVAWFQSGEWSYVLIIAAIFLAGQAIEGNFLTPRLVGRSVGMHPLWIFFALLAGGALFGILGMLLAVPVAAVIGVLAAFGIKRYKASPYYKSAKDDKKRSS